jgi:hypothetical protein
MTQYEFITKVNVNRKNDEHQAREWLKHATAFQLKKVGIGQNNIPIKLITNEFSVIGSKNCRENINQATKLILECYSTFQELILKFGNSTTDWKTTLEKLQIETRNNQIKTINPDDFKSDINHTLNQDLISIFRNNSHEDIGIYIENLVKNLEELKAKYEENSKINAIVYQTNGLEFRNILKNLYKIKQEDLPSEEGQEDLAYLGLYRHIGEILIYLDVIYDNAISLGLDPYLLYRKVLIHELAHAFHHRGFDAKDKIWDNFGYRERTRVYIIEGLAQWHAMQYMIYLDSKERNNSGENLMTIVWMSLFQAPQYRHYLNWVRYSNENIRRTIVEARAMTGTLVLSTDFDAELQLNHTKSV